MNTYDNIICLTYTQKIEEQKICNYKVIFLIYDKAIYANEKQINLFELIVCY